MSNEFPLMKTERLLLRQFMDIDLENVFKGLSRPDVIQYYGVSYSSLQEAQKQMEFFADLESTGTGIWWAICSLDNNIFYGACGLNNLIAEHRKAEIGFWLLQEHWGKGIITEAVPLVCRYGFEKLNLHRIEAIVETENAHSKRIMSKLSFSHEGTMKDCEVKNGRFISLDMYAKFDDV